MARCSLASSGISTERPPLLVVKMTALTAAIARKSGLRSSFLHAGSSDLLPCAIEAVK